MPIRTKYPVQTNPLVNSYTHFYVPSTLKEQSAPYSS